MPTRYQVLLYGWAISTPGGDMDRMIVVGGDAAGMSAASQARKRRGPEDLAIVAFERSSYISYSACGEPYYVAGYVEEIESLQARTPEDFRARDVEVHIRHEVTAIDTRVGRVSVRDLEEGTERTEPYDLLVYATGAAPLRPDEIEGLDLKGVRGLRTLDDALALRELAEGGLERVVVVGGGYIGLEAAEAFHHRGIPVTVVTSGPGVLERTLDPDMSELVTEGMRSIGIEVHIGTRVRCVEGRDGRAERVDCEGLDLPADLVLLGLGTRPEVELAEAAGIPLGDTGAVRVDPRQRTPVEGVWAAGDCAETLHRVSGRPVNFHLGTIANKQGRVAGMNIGGEYATFPGVVGTSITKVCGLEISRTGLTSAEAKEAGYGFVTHTVRSTTTAGYWPEAEPMWIKVLAERTTGRLLGGQIVGGRGAAKRIDVLATALWMGMRVDEMIDLDLAYAPPFSSVWDPLLIAARKGWEAVEEAS